MSTETKKIVAAASASVLAHVVLVFLLAGWIWLNPKLLQLPDLPQPEPLEITLVTEPEKIVAVVRPTPTPALEAIDSAGLQESKDAPEHPVAESDVNSKAASEKEATGNVPLPSQEGKERPFTRFETAERQLGSEPRDSSGAAGQAAALPKPETQPSVAATPAPTPEPEPEPTPLAVPGALPRPTPRSVSDQKLAVERPTPSPTPTPEPTPRQKPTPRINDLAMLKPTPRPVTRPQPPKGAPGYHPQSERTRLEGSISNRGKAGVDAVGTPLGRYRKAIADAIGSRWTRYVDQRMDLITIGTVAVLRFLVTVGGKAEKVEIVSNTSNTVLAEFSRLSITEAEIPPLPKEVAAMLNENRLEFDYSFTIYPN